MVYDRSSIKAAHLTSVHPWDDNRIFHRQCRTLAENGYQVTLVANEAAGEAGNDSRVRIVTQRQQRGRLRRVLVQVPKVLAAAWRLRADVYHLHDPELAALIPVLRARGARVIFDAHEDLPSQILDKHYIPARLRPVLARLSELFCALVEHLADHVVAATPTIAERFNPDNCSVVHNYPTILPDIDDSVDYADRPFALVYVGAMSEARGVRQMFDAVGAASLPAEWRFRVAGSFTPPAMRNTIAEGPGWRSTDDLGQVSKPHARIEISQARIGLVLFQQTTANMDALPTKMFEYMAAGVPLIASDFPLWRRIVLDSGCGLVVDPSDVEAIATAINYLVHNPAEARLMGERGRQAVQRQLNWGHEESQLLEVYRRLALQGSRREDR